MKFTSLLAALILCAPVVLADDRHVDFDASADFSRIKSFAIREGRINSQKPELDNRLFGQKLAKKLPGDARKLLSEYPPKKKKKLSRLPPTKCTCLSYKHLDFGGCVVLAFRVSHDD